MKQTLLIALAFIMALPACRKGEDDPYLSLRSRKNRMVGYWQLESYERSRDFGTVRSESYDAESSELVIIDEDSLEVRRPFSWDIEFNREGGYRSIQEERFTVDSVETPFSYTENRTIKGEWDFTGGNGEPNKSMLLLLPTEFSSTRSDQGSNIQIRTIDGQEEGMVWNIQRLSNEQLWLTYERVEAVAFDQETERVEVRFIKLDAPPSED